jgi:putative flippase GtrA
MRNTPKKAIRKGLKQLILYGIIGSAAASIDFALFHILILWSDIYYIVANCISVLTGILLSFSLNRSITFKVTDKIHFRLGLFFTCGMLGLALSNTILWIGIEYSHFNETVTKITSIFIVALFQFLFNKLITFKSST